MLISQEVRLAEDMAVWPTKSYRHDVADYRLTLPGYHSKQPIVTLPRGTSVTIEAFKLRHYWPKTPEFPSRYVFVSFVLDQDADRRVVADLYIGDEIGPWYIEE